MAKISTISSLALVALLGVSPHLHRSYAATPLEEAKSHLQTGTALYDEGNFRGALVEFRRAYDLAPSYKILFNIAQVQMELQDYAGAVVAYERYLREGGPDVKPERVTQVNQELERLRGRIGRLQIETTQGAEILVDDVSVGFAPLPESVVVNAGQRRVTAHLNGQETRRVVDVAGRNVVTLVLPLQASAATPAPSPVTAAKAMPMVSKPAGPPSKVPVYVSWGVTGGLGIAAGIFAYRAYSDSNELERLLGTYPVTAATLDAQRSKTSRDAAIADGFTAATLVAGGVALYFTLTRSSKQEQPKTGVSLLVGPNNIGMSGHF
jgi:tetratricopeptide (TPR) repeat protein